MWIRARVDTNRGKGKVCFLLLRRGWSKCQAVLAQSDTITKDMLKFAQKALKPETIIDIYGMIKAVDTGKEIKTAQPESLQQIEIMVKKIYSVAKTEYDKLPFELDDASRTVSTSDTKEDIDQSGKGGFSEVGQKVRLDNRWLDLRTNANHAIFRIQSAVCRFFREYLLSKGFTEIHSPKLIGAASEGGANVFKLKYFGNDAFLAQSPQLYKQMALCSDLFRVFEIGPVFRAEDSNTYRHLCEFTGMDLEMEFYEHYHEIVYTIGNLFLYIFNNLNKYCKPEIEAVRKQYPFKDLIYNDKVLILTFKEAMDMVVELDKKLEKEGKHKEREGLLLDVKDFSTKAERELGKLVLQKYGTEFYVIDKYPINARPFYTMIDPYNPELSNSYDFFLRGEEIMSGAQRIHDYKLLTERANYHNIPIHTLQEYINSFKYATSPHGGGGIGLERVVMLFLKLDNIRKSSMFPRDPTRCSP